MKCLLARARRASSFNSAYWPVAPRPSSNCWILFALCFFLLAAGAFASAPNVYVAQTAAGDTSGSSCANAAAATFFNTSSSWGSSSAQIGPGTTVHLCGTITSTLTVRGSGASGSPITILFESGAVVQQPVCNTNTGCLNMSGRDYIVVDGGATCGWIDGALVPCNGTVQSTLNGSPGGACPGGACTSQNDSAGIMATGCGNCEIRNLNIANIYVHSSMSDTTNFSLRPSAVYWDNEGDSVQNFLFHNNVVHDCSWCVMYNYGNDTNFQFYNNDISNAAHGIILAGYGPNAASGIKVYSNHIHDYANWDTGSADAFHLAGIHAYGTSNSHTTGTEVYDNLFGGPVTNTNFTAHIYMENYNFGALVYNNVLLQPSSGTPSFGMIAVGGGSGGPGPSVYNNTILGDGHGICILVNNVAGPAPISVTNNLCSGQATGIYYYSKGTFTVDYNIYAGLVGNNTFYNGSGYNSTLKSWQAATGQDTHSQLVSSANVNSDGTLQAGSPAIKWGANLASLGINELNSDFAGTPRPGPGTCGTQGSDAACWDVGAFELGGAGSPSKFTLTVLNGSGGGTYAAGASVTITANTPPSGQSFLDWTGASVQNATASSTTLVMPSSNTTITANFTAPVMFPLTVVSGSGSGTYAPAASVPITADPAPSGQTFAKWTGAAVQNATASATTLVMPAAATTVTATYATTSSTTPTGPGSGTPSTTHTLTVVNGTGDGNYAPGTWVTITANAAPSGQVFSEWVGANVQNDNAFVTKLRMPNGNVTVTARYRSSGRRRR
jgi:hypothetical protein